MTCPRCDGGTKVVDTGTDGRITVRKHECRRCGYKFFTEEKICERSHGASVLYILRHSK